MEMIHSYLLSVPCSLLLRFNMKLHPLTIIGALLATLATAFYVYVGAQEFLGNQATISFLFMGLLLLMILVAIFTWFKPGPMPICLAFVGIMLSTYNGVGAEGEAFLPAILSGTPFILAAILVLIGVKLSQRRADEAAGLKTK